jgi:hypothetical protein
MDLAARFLLVALIIAVMAIIMISRKLWRVGRRRP